MRSPYEPMDAINRVDALRQHERARILKVLRHDGNRVGRQEG